MTSFNHYALGAVADWMHRTIGGLTPTEPGYRRMVIHPRPGGGLTHARARHVTPYGLVECAWKIEEGKIDLDVVIPANTTAQVTLPGSDAAPTEVGSGTWHWSAPYEDPDARGPFTVDDLAGDIMSDSKARDTVVDVLARTGVREHHRAMILDERNIPLRESLQILPNYDEAVKMMDEALQSMKS
jgi:alpha-L-rhamnosidase